jgi:predicted RNase H-like HicB family nuclease
MLCVYPAIIHEDPDGLWAEFPDLAGCQTFSDTIENLLADAAEALECDIVEILEHGDALPSPTPIKSLAVTDNSYPTLIRIDVDLAKNTRSVKKTLTIPAWMNDRALSKGINFSKALQEALLAKLA